MSASPRLPRAQYASTGGLEFNRFYQAPVTSVREGRPARQTSPTLPPNPLHQPCTTMLPLLAALQILLVACQRGRAQEGPVQQPGRAHRMALPVSPPAAGLAASCAPSIPKCEPIHLSPPSCALTLRHQAAAATWGRPATPTQSRGRARTSAAPTQVWAGRQLQAASVRLPWRRRRVQANQRVMPLRIRLARTVYSPVLPAHPIPPHSDRLARRLGAGVHWEAAPGGLQPVPAVPGEARLQQQLPAGNAMISQRPAAGLHVPPAGLECAARDAPPCPAQAGQANGLYCTLSSLAANVCLEAPGVRATRNAQYAATVTSGERRPCLAPPPWPTPLKARSCTPPR